MPVEHADSASGLPLRGRTVVVTRAADQAAGLAEPLSALGAEVLLMPVIGIADPTSWDAADRAISRLSSYDWIVLTSVNGVDALIERLAALGVPPTHLSAARIAAVGSATAAHLAALGVRVDLVPESFRAEGVVEALGKIGPGEGDRVLLARAEEAREVLPEDLRQLGFTVDVVPVYRLVAAPVSAEVLERFAAGDVDVVTFASGGTARRFVEALQAAGVRASDALDRVAVASIGPVTSEALEGLGIAVDVQSPEATAESLAAAIAAHFSDGAR